MTPAPILMRVHYRGTVTCLDHTAQPWPPPPCDSRTWMRQALFNAPAGTRVEALFPPALGNSRIARFFIYLTNPNALSVPCPELDIARSWERCQAQMSPWGLRQGVSMLKRTEHQQWRTRQWSCYFTELKCCEVMRLSGLVWSRNLTQYACYLDCLRFSLFLKFMVSTWLPIFPVPT